MSHLIYLSEVHNQITGFTGREKKPAIAGFFLDKSASLTSGAIIPPSGLAGLRMRQGCVLRDHPIKLEKKGVTQRLPAAGFRQSVPGQRTVERRRSMIHLNLTPEEHRILVEVLSSDISDLSMEISGTDSQDYRQALRERKETLAKVIHALEPQGSA